ncbi:7577_t:CDS:2, partial [Funneliformis geosporum]
FMANVNKWERMILKRRYTASCKTHSKFEVIMLGYSDKNNRSNPHVKGGPIVTSQGEKNDISASSIIDTLDSPIEEEKTNDSNSVSLKSNLLEPILPVTSANEVSMGGAEGTVKLSGSPIATDKLLSS